MKFHGNNGEYLEIIDIDASNCHLLNEAGPTELSLIWSCVDENHLVIDTVDYRLGKNELLSLTEFHRVDAVKISSIQLIRWNRAFYCIVDHDSEVSCKGILYFGASSVPVMKAQDTDLEVLTAVVKMFRLEMLTADNLQLEMLQMMLKRLLILCTRMYKSQVRLEGSDQQVDLIREYNFLVEIHFKEKHTVKEYADMLFRSPKTLSNLFKKNGNVTPLQFIQNRIMLEAKRALSNTNQPVSDIGYDIGFSDVQVFSRFFRTHQGVSPQKFRDREKLTTS